MLNPSLYWLICFIQFQPSFILSHWIMLFCYIYCLVRQRVFEPRLKKVQRAQLCLPQMHSRLRVGFWLGEVLGQVPKKKYIPACGAQHTQPLQGGNQFFLSICIVAKNKKTLILCLVLVICTSIVNMQELRWRPGLQKYLALVCNQQYYLSLHQSCVFRLL